MCESKVALQQRVLFRKKRSSSSTDRVLPFPTCHFKVSSIKSATARWKNIEHLLFQTLQMDINILESLTFLGIKYSSSLEYGYTLKNLQL